MTKYANETLPLVPNHQDSNSNTINMTNRNEYSGDPVLRITFKGLFVAALAIILISSLADMAFVVEPGSIGLVVTLGSVVAVQSGLHIKPPFISKVIMFTAKTQKLEESNNTPTKEGLSVQLDTAM